MGAGAVVVSIVAVLLGMVALGYVATPGASSTVRTLVAGHLGLAFVGIVLLLVAVVAISGGLAWASFAVLVGAAALGLSLLVHARPSRQADPHGNDGASERDKGPVPWPIVILHGTAAATTILLVLLMAVGVAKS
jgi:hypothetical protein